MTMGRDHGASLIEVLITTALVAVVTALAIPSVRALQDEVAGRQAAGFVAGVLRNARQRAVTSGRSTAVVFDRVSDHQDWGFRLCTDDDGDGVLRSDVRDGSDSCAGPTVGLALLAAGTRLDRSSTTPDLNGSLNGSVVAFGNASMASFSPLGTSSSGSLFLRTSRGREYAVRVAGVTGRVTLFRFDVRGRTWRALL